MPNKISALGAYQGYSLPIYDGWQRLSQYVQARDGIRLAVDWFRPTLRGELHPGPLPLIWTHTAYQRSNITGAKLYTVLEQYPMLIECIRHGYIVGCTDARGMGASFGAPHGPWTPEEARDAYDITEWFAAQAWCDGNIGMMQHSYLGITQYFAAAESPPHLKAIFPEVASFDLYDPVRPGGIYMDVLLHAWGRDVLSASRSNPLQPDWRTVVEAHRDRPADASPWKGRTYTPTETLGGGPSSPVTPVDEDVDAKLLAEAIYEHRNIPNAHALFDALLYRDSIDQTTGRPLYAERSPGSRLEALADSAIPAYHLGGWYDGFTRDTTLWFRNYPNRQKMIIGPWFHGDRVIDLAAEYLRWFDFWLKGVDNGVMDEAPVHYWTVGAPDHEAWRAARTWPLPGESRTEYFFGAGPSDSIASVNDGSLTMSAPAGTQQDRYPVDYTTGTGPDNRWTWTWGGGVFAFGTDPQWFPYDDLRDNDRKALTYTSAMLESELEVTGHPVAHLWLASDAPDVDVYVYLERVEASGRSKYVSEGQLRASHRHTSVAPYDRMGLPYHRSHAQDIETLSPGVAVELILDLQPISVLYHPGERIRVTVTGADRDTFATAVVSPRAGADAAAGAATSVSNRLAGGLGVKS